MKEHRSTVSRFGSAAIETERSTGLRANHPALSEGRTLFPSTVAASVDSPRFLVSGHNNPKLGKKVLKGPRSGWPIYQLSLEERATCPRTCEQWSTCYGNAMPFARRHTPDKEFERYLYAEMLTLCRAHPEGLLVRLHALGDFYRPEYVYIWARLIADFPQLHVFGYTARKVDDADPESASIARAIKVLTHHAWDRFAIRTSGASGERSRSIVVDEPSTDPKVIMCPAQTSDTEACATCGLCWASAARDKTIGFLRHGMKTRGPKVASDATPVAPEAAASPPVVAPAAGRPADIRADRTLAALKTIKAERPELAYVQASYKELHLRSGVPMGSVAFAIYDLIEKGQIEVFEAGSSKAPSRYRIIDKSLPAMVEPTPKQTSPIRLTTTVAPRPVTRELAAPSADDLPQPANDARPRGLNARKPGQCAYPTNSPAPGHGDETEYCCAPVAGKLAYCADHSRAKFVSKRVAA